MTVTEKATNSENNMAKSKKRAKRSKKLKKSKWDSPTDDVVRTCVSGDKLERSCRISPLNLVDLSSISTPSPKLHVSPSESKLLEMPALPFRPRSRSSITKLNSTDVKLEKTGTLQNSANTDLTFKQNDFIENLNNYKTPSGRVRSNSLLRNFSTKTNSNANIEQENNNNVNELSFFTPELLNKFSTPNSKVNSMLRNSTPKINSRKTNLNINDIEECNGHVLKFDKSINTSERSMRSFSPILNYSNIKSSQKNGTKFGAPNLKTSFSITHSSKLFTKFRRFNSRWPIIIADIYTWIGVALRKSFAILKRYCYSLIIQRSSTIKECCHCEHYEAKLTILNTKFEEQAAEILRLKNELQSSKQMWQEFQEFKQQVLSMKTVASGTSVVPLATSLPPPPPPPPPPPMMPLFPIINPLKIVKKSEQKQSNSNTRPTITVDDILNVRLRKITTTTPIQRKTTPKSNEEVFKKVRLRPAARSQTPQNLGNSPKSSLARILKNVDTNVRTVRRIKTQFLSYDDISRQNSFRIRNVVNDSAPVICKN